MTVNIIAVGKLKESYYREAAAEYSKRLSAYVKANLIEAEPYALSPSPNRSQIEKALSIEAERIRAHIKPITYNVALCVEGKEISSEELAQKISDVSNKGISTINFIVGSSYGLSESIKESADYRLSMSRMTFPHALARVTLLEQLYRAYSIINNSKYHK